MKVFIVTGTPGTGKTTIAELLVKKYRLRYITVSNIIKDHKLSTGYDKNRNCMIVDEKKLVLILIDKIRYYRSLKKSKYRGIVIDSHLSQYLPNKFVDVCIVTKCSLTELKTRLEKRGYNPEKIRENLDAEIFDTCRVEAYERGHNLITLNTDDQNSVAKGLKDLHASATARITGTS
jgi:adenylate kinase